MKNSHRIRNSFSWGTLLAVFALLCASAVAPEAVHTQENKDKKKVFTDEDLKVEKIGGKWTIQTGPDFKQANDPSAPVVITYVNMFFGHGKYTGLVKILEAEIENRSPKLTQSIQLRWFIVSPEEPETVLLEGLIPFPEVRVEANSTSLVDIPPVYFNKVVKPLLKDGELTGTFRLMVGIQEVRFADGTVWERSRQTASLKAAFGNSPAGLKSWYFKPIRFLGMSLQQRPKLLRPIESAPCNEQPRLTVSAVRLSPLQFTDPPCRNNYICSVDPVAAKNICAPLTGSFCDLGLCDEEGHCNCGSGHRPCSTCPDDDGDTFAAERCGGTDCRDDNDFVNPRMGELCGDNSITIVTTRRIARTRRA